MDADCFDPSSDKPFHFGKLVAGSEGTLCFVTELKLHCNPLPPKVDGLLCAQFESIDEALRATQIAIRHECYACELIDHYILDCTERSIEHRENRFFIEGKPGAVLVTEIRAESQEEVLQVTNRIEAEMREAGLGYTYPVLFGEDTVKIWNLRKAGLGLLSNMPGDAKPVPGVEDTCVRVEDLPEYIAEFNRRLKERFGLDCVHYAHAGSGEIHLRPIIDLKTEEGNRMFREVARTVAELGALLSTRSKFSTRLCGSKVNSIKVHEKLHGTSVNYGLCRMTKPSSNLSNPLYTPNSRFRPGSR
jgi:FAD/FMN-containing dehydrogenase